MPGNEVGDRVHNFLDRDSLSQSQHHSQVAEGTFPLPNSNLWVGNHRQISTPLSYSPKNYNVHQSNSEKAHSSQSTRMPHGMNFMQPTLRSDFTKTQNQNQQPNLNGYMHGHQILHTRQNETNFLGVDTDSDRNNLTSRAFATLEQGNGPENTDSPVSFNFFGGQQPVAAQHPAMLPSLPSQQSGFNEMQLLHQQVMLKQMQELQRQKQLHQLESRQQNLMNQISSLANHSPSLINGTPVNDSLNSFMRQPELMGGTTNWVQPETGRSMGVFHDQSLYGVPISNTRSGSSQYSNIQIDKPAIQQIFPGNQHTVLPDQFAMQDGTLVSRQGIQGKNLFGQSLSSGGMLDNIQQMNNAQQRNASGTLHEKQTLQAPPSQNAATLDPTEERILFGNDDSIWDAFGRNSNVLGGTDFSNAFPSIQSGSWSALMQSAVAETPSSEMGTQEQWNGLSLHNPEITPQNNQPSMFNDNGKQQTVWIDNNLHVSSLNSRSFPPSNDPNLRGFQQSGMKYTNEQRERSQSNASQRPDSSLNVQAIQNYGNTAHSSGPELNPRSFLGSWAHQQKQNGQNVIESVPSSADRSFRSHENHNSFQQIRRNDSSMVMQGEMVHEVGIGNAEPVPSSSNLRDHGKSALGSPHINRPDLSTVKSNQETGHPPSSFQFNNWKRVDSGAKTKGSEGSGSFQHNLNRGPQVLESSANSTDKETVDCSKRDGQLRENAWLDASKQKSSGQLGRKTSGGRKFQYHPMGNLDVDVDVEPSFGMKHGIALSQAMAQQLPQGLQSHEHGLLGHSKVVGNFSRNFTEIEKGRLTGLQGKGEDDLPSSGILSGYAASPGINAPNKSGPSSQNMLELLHKVDQSREHNSSDYNPSSEKPEPEMSDGSVGQLQQNQSVSSQGFSLQLGPPSQRVPVPNRPLSSQTSQNINASSSAHSAPVLFLPPSREPSQVNNMQGGFSAFTPGFHNARSQLQNQQVAAFDGLVSRFKQNDDACDRAQADSSSSCPPNDVSSAGNMPQPSAIKQPHSRVLATQTSAPQPVMSFPSVSHNIWTTIGTQSGQSRTTPFNLFHHQPKPTSTLEANSLDPHKCDNQDSYPNAEEQLAKEKPHQQVLAENLDRAQKINASEGTEPSILWNAAASQRDIEAFGRSLKPNNSNYSLLHQMQAMKNTTETDPSDRGSKRFKGSDAIIHHVSAPSSDSKLLSFSSDSNAPSHLPQGNVPSHNLAAFGRSDSENYSSSSKSIAPVRENSQISPQMAPSWFNQFGTFKNGQILPITEARNPQSLIIGKPIDSLHTHHLQEQVKAPADTCQVAISSVQQDSITVTVANESFSSPHSLPPSLTDQHLVAVRPKKRKSSTSELLPWHKEIIHGSGRPFSVSMAEQDWSQVANRLTEKVEDEAEMCDDGLSLVKPKRRLVLTTQLMQQLLRPPPASVLSLNSRPDYDSVVYSAARLELGDTCSLVSSSESDFSLPAGSRNLLAEKMKTIEGTSYQHFTKVVEDFVDRARKLENDLLRLDKRASILDVRLECQDLEKFSVINRFAKFHGRAQADGAETSSSSSAPANIQKIFPQRYVTAIPSPRNFPDRVQCLSL